MATLGEVSFYTRRIIKWGIIVVLAVMIIPVIFGVLRRIYLALLPPPPAPPTVQYGKLPTLIYSIPTVSYKPQFRLETIQGVLPKLTTIGRVYFVETNRSRILSLDRIRSKAKTLGFVNEPERLNERTFNFVHPLEPATLTVDTISDKFSYQYDWASDTSLYTTNPFIPKDQAVNEAKSFLQNLNLLPSDIADTNIKVTFLAANPPNLTPVTAPSEANFIHVDLFRADRDNLAFVTPVSGLSPINITFGSSKNGSRRVIEANFNYSKTLDNDFATYPLKTTQQAWDELTQGGGIIVKTAGQQVTIRKVTLAYFESDLPQRFLQPVFVFEGDGGFTAYVQAISPDYVDQGATK